MAPCGDITICHNRFAVQRSCVGADQVSVSPRAPHQTVVVKRTFIEVLPVARTQLRGRYFSDSFAVRGMDERDQVWEKISPDVLSDSSDVSTSDDEGRAVSGSISDGSSAEMAQDDPQIPSASLASETASPVCPPMGFPVQSWTAPVELSYHPRFCPMANEASYSYTDCWWVGETECAQHFYQPPAMCDQTYFGHESQGGFMWSGSKDSLDDVRQQASCASTVREGDANGLQSEGRTTVMLRNVPKSCSREMLRAVIDAGGFAGEYDLVYVPVEFAAQVGLGYAFVNFLTSAIALRCFDVFEGFAKWPMPSDTICSVTWSSASQGLQAHIDRYQNSPVMHHSIPDAWKPGIYSPAGVRVSFPAPTKTIAAPKIRQPRGGSGKPVSPQ